MSYLFPSRNFGKLFGNYIDVYLCIDNKFFPFSFLLCIGPKLTQISTECILYSLHGPLNTWLYMSHLRGEK